MDILKVNYVSKTYRKGTQKQVALEPVSFNVEEGETFGIIGESGCGKSTLLRLLAQLEVPSTGTIEYQFNSRVFYRNVQMVFQNPGSAMDPRKKIGYSVEEPLRYLKPDINKEERQKKISNLLKAMQLDEKLLARFPYELSGGECQRMAIVRALSVDPKVLLCDEITSALDSENVQSIWEKLENFKKEKNLTLLWVTHDLQQILDWCERCIVLRRGFPAEVETVSQIKNPYFKQLLRASRWEGLKR